MKSLRDCKNGMLPKFTFGPMRDCIRTGEGSTCGPEKPTHTMLEMRRAKTIKIGILTITALGAGYCLGYLEGSGSSHGLAIVGQLGLATILLLVLAALAKIIVALLVHRKGGPPPGGGKGGGGPRPPRAPVPRPPGGRPPALSAAAEVKLGSAT